MPLARCWLRRFEGWRVPAFCVACKWLETQEEMGYRGDVFHYFWVLCSITKCPELLRERGLKATCLVLFHYVILKFAGFV